MKSKYLIRLIVFEPWTSREEFLVKELPVTCNYSLGWMEKKWSSTIASDVAI